MLDKKAAILVSGRELFGTKGFKGTSVNKIAKKAGIGVGTFYNYYSSKEELFLEVYIKENVKLKKHLVESIAFDDDPVMLITKLMKQTIDALASNLVLKEWYNKELFSKLEHYFYEENSMKSINEYMHSSKAELIQKWKGEGKIRFDLEEHMIIAIFNSILYIDIHKSEIGIQYFPELLYYVTELIMKGLMLPGEKFYKLT